MTTTNWKKLVQKAAAETFRLPPGWDTREKVAEQLDCAVERVAERMRPLLTCKPPLAEAKAFDVWDAGLERKVRVMAYREIHVPTRTPAKTEAPGASPLPSDRAFAIQELRTQGLSWAAVARSVGCSKTNVQRIAKQHGMA